MISPTISPSRDQNVLDEFVPVPGYAEFSDRFIAVFIDNLVLIPVMVLMRLTLGAWAGTATATGLSLIAVIVVDWLYEACFLCSDQQATFGKMLFLIRVTDTSGQRLTFGRATIRHFARRLFSDFTFEIGYLMALFTRRKQALHDMVAGTLVIRG